MVALAFKKRAILLKQHSCKKAVGVSADWLTPELLLPLLIYASPFMLPPKQLSAVLILLLHATVRALRKNNASPLGRCRG